MSQSQPDVPFDQPDNEPPAHPPEKPGHPLTAADAWVFVDKEIA